MAKTNQHQQLRVNFNHSLNQALNTQSINYFGTLSGQRLIILKKMLSGINNVITQKTTIAFANVLCQLRIINQNQCTQMIGIIMNASPNSPGFDVNHAGIIAEVKCNIPVYGTQFGQGQITGIEHDIDNLLNGKGQLKGKTSNYYKFFVLLDDGQYVTQAMNNLIYLKNWGNIIKDITQFNPNDRNSIYLVYIPISSI